MAASKFYVASCALLLIGVVLLGQQGIVGAVACPQFCLDVDYVTCPSSGSEKLPASCNCCMTPKGCTLHLSDGTQQTCS
uniref:Type II proteinase inhibitor family protein n=1 Tax=Zea mays TaxID=4577 RepID=B6SSS5_MAIZE|nr:type II proteinase inhibitor family protein [Zea mays]